LERLREFIEVKNPVVAQRVAREILLGIDKLKVFPKMGVQVLRAPQPELVRDLFIGNYTVRYMITKEELIILRLWHDKEIEKDL
jgi:plasmid stabilization system protein ParE